MTAPPSWAQSHYPRARLRLRAGAGVRVAAGDDAGRERLLRYCARPPLSLERLSRLPDGRVAYALRKPWGKQTHRVMQPLEFLARLAALVPPPRHPLIRFHGVLASHSSWRSRVVKVGASAPDDLPPPPCAAKVSQTEGPATAPRPRPENRQADRLAGGAAVPVATELHFSPSSRIPWAELLKRIHDVDALACPCGGRLRFISLILEPEAAQAILESLGLASRPPPIARARSPDLGDG